MNSYEVFVSIVKYGSFSAAAKKIHRTPSAVSKQISQLESQLNVQLFDRTTRNLKLTEAGQIYYERAQDIVKRMQDAKTELLEFSGEPNGRIRITFPNSLSDSPIIPVLAEFTQRYPNVSFDINVSVEKKSLIKDDFDFAFRIGPLPDSGMKAIRLFDIEPAFTASPELIKKHGEPPRSINELLRYPLLTPNNMDIVKQLIASASEGVTGKQGPFHTGVDITTFLNLAKAGFSASFCFKHSIAEHVASGALVDITPPDLGFKVPVSLVFQPYQHMPAKFKCFIEMFRSVFIEKNASN